MLVVGYQSGDFDKAIVAYESRLSDDFQNASVLFNLGNSFYKSKQLGRSVAAFLKANQLAPRDPDIKANLDFAMKAAKDDLLIPSSPSFISAITMATYISVQELFWMAVVTLTFGSISTILWIVSMKKITMLRLMRFLVIPGFALFILYGIADFHQPKLGSVIYDGSKVYGGPSDQNSVVVFELNEELL